MPTIAFLGVRAHIFKPYTEFLGYDVVILDHYTKIRSYHDLVICFGYYHVIPPDVLKIPKLGIYVVHETDLPEGRGHAPLNWTILNKKDRLTVTLFKAEGEVDAGPTVCKRSIPISKYQTIRDLRELANRLTLGILRDCLISLISGTPTLTPQIGNPTYYNKRNPDDSEIDINKSILDQWDLIRATQNPDYQTFFKINGVRFNLIIEKKL